MLLHQLFSDYYGAWRALEKLYEEGKIRAIGVSNFYPYRMVDIASFGEGRGGLSEDETLKAIGSKHNKSTAQIMLRWHIQRGVVIIPKSTYYKRMVENLNVFDFALSEDDMEQIKVLDKNESAFFSHNDPAMVEWFVQMVVDRKK